MSIEIQSLLMTKLRLQKEILVKSKALKKMLSGKAFPRCQTIEDFPGNENIFFEREESINAEHSMQKELMPRIIREVEDSLSALNAELTKVIERETFMIRTTVQFPLTINCY